MTLHCDEPIAAPLTLRSLSYAAAALRSVKQAPALPDQTPLSDCPADAERTTAADHAEMAEERLDIDQCDLQWGDEISEADEIDEADDCDWSADWSSEWSRLDFLSASLHSVPAPGHSRKSRRAPPHSQRTSAAALRAVTSHSGALAAACARAAPAPAANVDSESDADQCTARKAKHSTGRLPSPFIGEETYEKLLAQQRKQRAARDLQLRQLRQSGASDADADEALSLKASPTAAAAPAPRKGELRAAVTAARKLPLHLHRCDNPRWAAVLQARAATKQHTAELKAHGPRPAVQIAEQRQPRAPKGAHKAARVEAAAETRKQRRDQQEAKRQMQLQLRQGARQTDANADANVQPLTVTLLVTIAVTRWAAANPMPAAATGAPRTPRAKRSKVRPIAPLRMRPAVRAVSAAPMVPKCVGMHKTFAAFRRSWYYAHRSQLESALNGSVLSLRLATPALHVQQAFAQRMRELGDPQPLLTFHGTAAANTKSILDHGFLRPGSSAGGRSVGVANGSSFGKGVYSSTTADFSVGYCRGHTTMFVCAMLMGSPQPEPQPESEAADGRARRRGCQVRVHHNIVVAFDERRIVPLFFLDFDQQHFDDHYHSNSGSFASAPSQPPVAGTVALDKQDRALRRKMDQRAMGVPPKRMLRSLLRAMHSRRARSGQQLKQAQWQFEFVEL